MTWDKVDPVAKKVISHLSYRNVELKSEKQKKERAERVALFMLHECGGDVFEYALSVQMWRSGLAMSTIRPYYSKKTGRLTSYAHYNKNGIYIKRCNKDDPSILVPTGMIVDREHFDWTGEDFVAKEFEEPPQKKLKLKANLKKVKPPQ